MTPALQSKLDESVLLFDKWNFFVVKEKFSRDVKQIFMAYGHLVVGIFTAKSS
jgi:hypothetical protein